MRNPKTRGPKLAARGAVALAFLTAGIHQPTATDAGTFTVLIGGAKVGREEFTIRSVPAPATGYVIEGTLVYPTRRIHRLLQTDAAGAPLRYQADEQLADRHENLITLEVTRGHASERIQTARGESASEFLVPAGVRLLDVDLFEQYFFIARDALRQDATPPASRSLSVLIPARAAVGTARVELVAPREVVDVGGQPLPAVHIRVRFDAESADVWTDQAGRVLRIAIPSRRLVAVRDEPPR